MSGSLFDQYKAALRRGHLAALAGNLDEALEAYRAAGRLVPDRALPVASQGTVLHRLDRWPEAADAFERALQLAPDDEAALRARAIARAERGLRSGAAGDYEKLAFVLDVAGRAADAADAARKAANLEPSAAREALADRLAVSAALRAQLLPGEHPSPATRFGQVPEHDPNAAPFDVWAVPRPSQEPESADAELEAAAPVADAAAPAADAPAADLAPADGDAGDAGDDAVDAGDAGGDGWLRGLRRAASRMLDRDTAFEDAPAAGQPDDALSLGYGTFDDEPPPPPPAPMSLPEDQADPRIALVPADALGDLGEGPELVSDALAARIAELGTQPRWVEMDDGPLRGSLGELGPDGRPWPLIDLPSPAPAPIVGPPPDPEELLADAAALLAAGDDAAARDRMLTAVMVHREAGRLDAALDVCLELLGTSPGDPQVHLAIANLELDHGWTSVAAEKIELLIRLTSLTGDTQAEADAHGLASERLRDEPAHAGSAR